jgi:hypothetical protein
MSQANYCRIESGQVPELSVERVSEIASILGFEISLGLHPIGVPLRDKGQLAVGRRFDALLSAVWRVTNETLLPGTGELRAWDKLLRLIGETPPHLVGVDIETRVWDVQAIVRRTRGRERDGHVSQILIVLGNTAHNRQIADQLRHELGSNYETSPRQILAALRAGRRLPGSGVVLI